MSERIVDIKDVPIKTIKELNSEEALAFLWGLPVCEEVVRCRDCKYTCAYGDGIECLGPLVQTWDYHNDQPLHNPVPPNGFCAWGERRDVLVVE